MSVTTFSDAISAYRAAARSAMAVKPSQDGDAEADATAAPRTAFSDMVKDAVVDAVDSGRKAENLSMNAITGKADLRDVVTAVTNAELTLETVVAIRDKVVNAYNEILKMPM